MLFQFRFFYKNFLTFQFERNLIPKYYVNFSVLFLKFSQIYKSKQKEKNQRKEKNEKKSLFEQNCFVKKEQSLHKNNNNKTK